MLNQQLFDLQYSVTTPSLILKPSQLMMTKLYTTAHYFLLPIWLANPICLNDNPCTVLETVNHTIYAYLYIYCHHNYIYPENGKTMESPDHVL